MANHRITVKLNRPNVGKFLKSNDIVETLRDTGKKVAQETEADYAGAGKDYSFKVWPAETSQRARIIVGSKDGDPVRYSEAARGYLLNNANKKRGAQ